jgi:MoxR-like ATPase
VGAKVPAISETLSSEVTAVMQAARNMNLSKVPGVAETLDWATALVTLKAQHLDHDLVRETMGCFLKDETDLRAFEVELDAGHLKMIHEPPTVSDD